MQRLGSRGRLADFRSEAETGGGDGKTGHELIGANVARRPGGTVVAVDVDKRGAAAGASIDGGAGGA